jgi:hypothetical protein
MNIYAREKTGSDYDITTVKKVKTGEISFRILHFEPDVSSLSFLVG